MKRAKAEAVWTDEQIGMLGTLPDAEVSARTGHNYDAVWAKRRTLGIAPCRRWSAPNPRSRLSIAAADPRPGDVVRLHRPEMEPGKIDTAIAAVLSVDGGDLVRLAFAFIGGPVFERDLEIDDWRKLLAGVDVYDAFSPPHVATVIYLSDRADSAHRAMTGGEPP